MQLTWPSVCMCLCTRLARHSPPIHFFFCFYIAPSRISTLSRQCAFTRVNKFSLSLIRFLLKLSHFISANALFSASTCSPLTVLPSNIQHIPCVDTRQGCLYTTATHTHRYTDTKRKTRDMTCVLLSNVLFSIDIARLDGRREAFHSQCALLSN